MEKPTEISYECNKLPDLNSLRDIYRNSTLAERRPVDNETVFVDMMKHANLVITARTGDRYIGISRSLTDFGYICYLADLAVDRKYQRLGVGRKLIEETRKQLGPDAKIVLLAAPAAVDYYPKIGFTKHNSAWLLNPADQLK